MADALMGMSNQEQAEAIADYYSRISNEYDPICEEDFLEYSEDLEHKVRCIEPRKVHEIINGMNKKAATVPGDIPIKLMVEFSVEIAFPLAHIINTGLKTGKYPNIWKNESVSPAPKTFPTEKIKDLRKISGLLNCSKVTDKIIGEYLIQDMADTRDRSQYGNEKNLSINHYLIKMLHRILCAVDRNSQSEAFAVILNLIDWSQAFDRQSHKMGVQSFEKNGVRPALIPILSVSSKIDI